MNGRPHSYFSGQIPDWAANLILFSLLITIVLGVFLRQMHQISASMQHNALGRARMVGAVIEYNLQHGVLTGKTIDSIVTRFLHDKAKFIEYLDSVEPLHEDELIALGRETGLAGIILVRSSGRSISGSPSLSGQGISCSKQDGMLFYRDATAYLVHHPDNGDQDLHCVIIGLDATDILNLRRQSSLPVLIKALTTLPGIRFIRVETHDTPSKARNNKVSLLKDNNGPVAMAVMQTSLGTLKVGLDATNFVKQRDIVRNQFIFFGFLLLILGFLFSWMLYRYQQKNLQRTRNFERMLAREHENAVLGRATSTIAHEIKNPLNAINIGLQRLQMESDNLDTQQREMLTAMREAVSRTSTIIKELQRYTRKLQPERQPVHINEIINRLVTLYTPACEQQGIRVTTNFDSCPEIYGDRQLLAELFENLVKNAVEAQPEGGYLDITCSSDNARLVCILKNNGFSLTGQDRERPGEPYFTDKTHGTGLGLALCRRIVEAHNGRLAINTSRQDSSFEVTVTLPFSLNTNNKTS
jgi:signal transduction histidine kinase